MTHITLNLLGSTEIKWREGQPPRFRSPTAVALLAYLAVEDRPVTRATLATLFWPDNPETQALGELRRVLHNLSTVLPGCIHADRRVVRFQATADCQLDIATFRQLQAQGGPDALRQAADLYQGEFLEGVYLADSPGFENWLLGQRAFWQQCIIQVLEDLIDHFATQAEYEAGLRFARRLVTLAPWHEAGHRQIMVLLARSGRRNAALAQYEICRRNLAEELDVEPLAETMALYRRLKTAVYPSPYPLPPQPTPFIGREQELAKIRRLLANPACRLLTILGAGGIGKTRLAIQAAQAAVHEQALMFLHGVVFVPLAGLETAALLAPTIANALRFSFHGSQSPEKQLLDYLREKELLLILDNFEHLLPEVDLLPQILNAALAVKLMATSRERLSLREEWLFDIDGLPYPVAPDHTKPAGRWRDYSAVRLFEHIAQREQRQFSLDEAGTAVIQICQLVDGMPLALELAAASVRAMSPVAIAQEIEQNLQLLQTSLRNVPDRHRSIQAVFDHSWRRLTPAERDTFQQLSVFRGSFSLAAAVKITGASPQVLERLLAKSLLRQTEPGRYEMHELLRRLADEKLCRDERKVTAVYGRHSAYYADLLARQENDLKAEKQIIALQEIDKDMQNVRLAWQQLPVQGRIEQMDSCLDALFLHYDLRSRHQEGEALLQTAVDRLAATGSTILLARLKTRLARFVSRQDRYDDALQLLQNSTAVLLQTADNPAEIALSQYLVGEIKRLTGAAEKAKETLHESWQLYKALDDTWGVARTLIALGDAARQLGEFEEARKYCQQSLALFTKTGDKWGTAAAFHILGLIAYEFGDYEAAKEYYNQGLAIRRDIGDRWGVAMLLNSLGIVTYDMGQYDEADVYYEESLTIAQELGSQGQVAVTLNNLGVGAAKRKAYAQARNYYRQCLAICREIGDQHSEAIVLTSLGEVALELAAYDKARQYLQESLRQKRSINYIRGVIYTLACLGNVSLAEGNYREATGHYREALSLALDANTTPRLLDALTGTAALLSQTGQPTRAVELLALVCRQPGNEKSTQERAERLLNELSARLPPAGFAAAQSRGEAGFLSAMAQTVLAKWLQE